MNIQGDFSTDLADHDNRFIALHFENIRCADLKSICKASGCLHQVYASKENRPDQLLASNYVIEVELGHFDGAVGAKVTSRSGRELCGGTSIEDAASSVFDVMNVRYWH